MPRPFRNPDGISTRDRIHGAALDLFEAHGYDEVTVEDVAARAGVTERTVFRYFSTKPALVLEPTQFSYFVPLPENARSLAEAVREAMAALAGRIEARRAPVVRQAFIVRHSIALRAAARTVGEQALQALRADVARLTGEDPGSARVYVLAEVIYAIAFGARNRWFDDPGVRIADVLDESLAAASDFLESMAESAA